MPRIKNTTPSDINNAVRRLCKSLGAGGNPTFLEVRPESDAEPDECFHNVQKKVLRDGGKVVHGWKIWEMPGVLIEGVFHGVWESPQGEMLDVTPNADHEPRILFLPDPSNLYYGVQVNNVRQALSRDKIIVDFIAILDEEFRIMNEGQRRYLVAERSIPEDEIVPIVIIHNQIGASLEAGLTEDSPCFCNSGRKYKNCHSKTVSELIRRNR